MTEVFSMKIAIYSRKSKATDKGESIENQINSCKDYILKWSNLNTSDTQFIIYQDEGFTGSNTERPQFQKLLNDAKKDKFNMLICYRLDRVSRNIADFSNTYELLQEHGIEFVSVKEQFDTSTPIGRAMLNIAMVFAQLERETIAERIKDNMLGLARTGRWLGGTTPTGFNSEPIEYLDHNMNTKKMYKLSIDENEIEKVKLIFTKFMELKSLRSTESYLLIHDIYSKNNCKYTAATIKDILTNPVYAAADSNMYDYLSSLGCQICNEEKDFDGTYGIMSYNKTDQVGKSISTKDYSEWIISIGKHTPIVEGTDWVSIQGILNSNTQNSFYTKETMQYGLLTNMIKCAHCGANMKIKKGKINVKGELAYSYVCTTKEMSRRTKCNVKNVLGQEVDADVFNYLVDLAENNEFMSSIFKSNKAFVTQSIEEINHKVQALTAQIEDNDLSMKNLMSQLAKLPAEHPLVDLYMKQLSELDTSTKALRSQIQQLHENGEQQQVINLNLDSLRKAFTHLKDLKDSTDIHMQRSIIRSIVDYITWDGENLQINLFGQDILKKNSVS